MKITAKAPTRIDLAGGTIDLWPIFLFLNHPKTINLGIDLFAEASFDIVAQESVRHSNPGILLRSEDQRGEQHVPWEVLLDPSEGIETTNIPTHLVLHFSLLKQWLAYNKPSHIDFINHQYVLSTRAQSPAGAGLGGSSTLSIAILGCLYAWTHGRPLQPHLEPTVATSLIEFARDVETPVIKVPAGMQDYFGAMFGGLQQIEWNTGVNKTSQLDAEVQSSLENRIQLFYSGRSRQSGINNWALFKHFIDQEGTTRSSFRKIVDATQKLSEALLRRDFLGASRAIEEEWNARRQLAPGISTPEIDRAFALMESQFSSTSGKICGAGGGGCFFFFHGGDLPTQEQRTTLSKDLESLGIRELNFKAATHGLMTELSAASKGMQ